MLLKIVLHVDVLWNQGNKKLQFCISYLGGGVLMVEPSKTFAVSRNEIFGVLTEVMKKIKKYSKVLRPVFSNHLQFKRQ
jgi:hypothetical protein